MSNGIAELKALATNFILGNMKEDLRHDSQSDSITGQFLDVLRNSNASNGLVDQDELHKFKPFNHQLVLETEEIFYKIYERDESELARFYSEIRSNLSQLYEELGLEWEVLTVWRDGITTDIEKRQKVKVLSRDSMSFKDALRSFSVILAELENRLEFPDILRQLKRLPEFSNIEKLKLIRLTANKFDDYAVFNDQVVLLDDTDWCIALVNYDGEPANVEHQLTPRVHTGYGDFLFVNHFVNVIKDGDLNYYFEECPIAGAGSWWNLKSVDFDNSGQESKNFLSLVTPDKVRESRLMTGSSERRLINDIALMKQGNIIGADADDTHSDKNGSGENAFMIYELPFSEQSMRSVAEWDAGFDISKERLHRCSGLDDELIVSEDLRKVSEELDVFEELGCDTIALKGNFFEGALEQQKVKNDFCGLMKKCCDLRKEGVLKQLWITVPLSKGPQIDLYNTLDFLEASGFNSPNEDASDGLWLCTQWNPVDFMSTKEMKNWKFQMKNIYNYYPWIKKHTDIVLTQGLCEFYLSGKYKPHEFAGNYKTSISYSIPRILNPTANAVHQDRIAKSNMDSDSKLIERRLLDLKAEMSKNTNGNYLPKRNTFRKFLYKYEMEDKDSSSLIFLARTGDKRAIVSLGKKGGSATRRVGVIKDVKTKGKVLNPFCRELDAEGRHPLNFSFYEDSSVCAFCDIKQVIQG